MNRIMCVILLYVILLLGCSTIQNVNGNAINYPNGESFVVNESYRYIGSAAHDISTFAYDQPKVTSGVDTSYIFIKTNNNNSIDSLVGLRSFLIPNGWYMRERGLKQDFYYQYKTESVVQLKELLTRHAGVVDKSYYCGEFFKYIYKDGFKAINVCVSKQSVPNGERAEDYIVKILREAITIATPGSMFSYPSLPVPEKEIRPYPALEKSGLSAGKYPALNYSRNNNSIYFSRSNISTDDAADRAARMCSGNDCRSRIIAGDGKCIAIAVNKYGGHGRASGDTEDAATTEALRYCNSFSLSDNCVVRAILCPE